MHFTGSVTSGRGLATGIIANLPIADILGVKPYPGTLNLVLRSPVLLKWGNEKQTRTGHLFWRAKIFDRPCLIMRWKNCPLHIAEIVSDIHLRGEFNLYDGSLAQIECENAISPTSLRRLAWAAIWAGRRPLPYASNTYQRRIAKLSSSFMRLTLQNDPPR
jgi:hypothetical protein